jgi:hypothetical protein
MAITFRKLIKSATSRDSRPVGGRPGSNSYNYPKNDFRSSTAREKSVTAGKQSPFRKMIKSISPGGSQGSDLHTYPNQETLSRLRDDTRRTNRERNRKPSAEVVVAIMGLTGAGKSSFIQTVTEYTDVGIGHGLDSGTFLLMILSNCTLCFKSDD